MIRRRRTRKDRGGPDGRTAERPRDLPSPGTAADRVEPPAAHHDTATSVEEARDGRCRADRCRDRGLRALQQQRRAPRRRRQPGRHPSGVGAAGCGGRGRLLPRAGQCTATRAPLGRGTLRRGLLPRGWGAGGQPPGDGRDHHGRRRGGLLPAARFRRGRRGDDRPAAPATGQRGARRVDLQRLHPAVRGRAGRSRHRGRATGRAVRRHRPGPRAADGQFDPARRAAPGRRRRRGGPPRAARRHRRAADRSAASTGGPPSRVAGRRRPRHRSSRLGCRAPPRSDGRDRHPAARLVGPAALVAALPCGAGDDRGRHADQLALRHLGAGARLRRARHPATLAGSAAGLLRGPDRVQRPGHPRRARGGRGSLTLALVAFGGSTTATLSAVLLYRLIAYWSIIPCGTIAWLALRATSRPAGATP